MVATRRSGANAVLMSNASSNPTKRRKVTANGTAEKAEKPVTVQPPISRTISLSTNSTAPSKPSSALRDLTLTSPSTSKTSEERSPIKPNPLLHEQARPSTEQVMLAWKKLVMPGSSHNPIVLIEDSPPSKDQTITARHRKVEPHKFQDRHNKQYTYKPSRSALAPNPANESMFIGHQSHDIYRMRTAKMTQPAWHLGRIQHVQQGHSFEMQYPMSARYLTSQQDGAYPSKRPEIYYAPPLPSYPQHMAPPPPNEEHLRRKAVQYVKEYSRPSPRKRKLAEDPDETSESESEKVNRDTAVFPCESHPKQTPISSTKSRSSPVTILPDPHYRLTPLIEHASLLTSLLQAYPQSTNQKGLREDIAMLASVQNQHLADWLNFEVGQSRKPVKSHTPHVSRSTISFSTRSITPVLTEQERAEVVKRKEQDEEIRSLLSADAKLWQDGSGLGVADVYAATRASTPPAILDEEDETCANAAVVSASSLVRCRVDPESIAKAGPRGVLRQRACSKTCDPITKDYQDHLFACSEG